METKGYAENRGKQFLRAALQFGFKLGQISVRDVLEPQRQHRLSGYEPQDTSVRYRAVQATLSFNQIRWMTPKSRKQSVTLLLGQSIVTNGFVAEGYETQEDKRRLSP